MWEMAWVVMLESKMATIMIQVYAIVLGRELVENDASELDCGSLLCCCCVSSLSSSLPDLCTRAVAFHAQPGISQNHMSLHGTINVGRTNDAKTELGMGAKHSFRWNSRRCRRPWKMAPLSTVVAHGG
mmetsp:Transcript_21303/g.50103  ORF Transcript_21303/g.50103 Transcript_21303/m.50103 type:complete len:128 (+) Transcript_21303:948-1331(+)